MKLLIACAGLALLSVCSLNAADSTPVRIALIGDSTVCDYPATSPKRGWGQILPEYLESSVVVKNEAKGGESTLSFPKENWERVRQFHPDYVLIQFGHNDMKKDRPDVFADSATSYRDNLKRYITEARQFGATPILVTPVRRRNFRNGQVTSELAPYADAMKAVGADMKVAVIDLHESSRELFQRLGEAGTDSFTANKLVNADAKGNGDRTHFTEAGAREIARIVAEGLSHVDDRLSKLVLKEKLSPATQAQ